MGPETDLWLLACADAPDDAMEEALRALVDEDFGRAEELLSGLLATSAEGSRAPLHSWRSVARFKLRRFDDALDDAGRATRLEPRRAIHHYRKGCVGVATIQGRRGGVGRAGRRARAREGARRLHVFVHVDLNCVPRPRSLTLAPPSSRLSLLPPADWHASSSRSSRPRATRSGARWSCWSRTRTSVPRRDSGWTSASSSSRTRTSRTRRTWRPPPRPSSPVRARRWRLPQCRTQRWKRALPSRASSRTTSPSP